MTDQTAQVEAPKKKRGCMFYGLCGLGGLIVLAAIGNMAEKDQRAEREAVASGAKAPEGKPIKAVTAAELFTMFSENEVAAKAAFDGQRIQVTGVIEEIALDFSDEPVVRLRTGERFEWVAIHLGDEGKQVAAQLAKGQKITVLCDRVNEVMGNPQVSDCTLVPVAAPAK